VNRVFAAVRTQKERVGVYDVGEGQICLETAYGQLRTPVSYCDCTGGRHKRPL